jgi:hypothetical protein
LGPGIIGGMIGEPPLALLYVRLFFYISDGRTERGAAAPAPGETVPAAPGGTPAARPEGD